MADEQEYWLSHIGQPGPPKLLPDSLTASNHIEEGEEGEGVGHHSDGLHYPDDRQVKAPEGGH